MISLAPYLRQQWTNFVSCCNKLRSCFDRLLNNTQVKF
uniref:Uncharacterized protein n=1 Tax=Klebsiella phage FKP3 TaxID=3231233 RepID=A0AAU8HYZ6_9CAUD